MAPPRTERKETVSPELRQTDAAVTSQTYTQLVWSQFKKNRMSIACLYGIAALALLALGADLVAGNKPYYMVYRGKTFFPAFRQYASPSTASS